MSKTLNNLHDILPAEITCALREGIEVNELEGHAIWCKGCDEVPVGDARSFECWESPKETLHRQAGSKLKPLSAVDPDHYDFPGGVQVIDITKHLDFLAGNVVKYICRAGRKGDKVTDLLKAKQYLEWLIERESGE